MRWSLWAVRSAIIGVNLLIAAIIVLSIVPFATGDISVSVPEGGENEPTMEGNTVTLALPIDVTNEGYFNIEGLMLHLLVTSDGVVITDHRSEPVDIPTGGTSRVNLQVEIDMDSIPEESMRKMVFDQVELMMEVEVEAAYSLGLVKAAISIQQSMEWDPLISDYNIDTGNIQMINNGSMVNVVVPYSFRASEMAHGKALNIGSQLINSTGVMSSADHSITIQDDNHGQILFVMSQEEALWLMSHPESLTLAVDLECEGATMHQEFSVYSGGMI